MIARVEVDVNVNVIAPVIVIDSTLTRYLGQAALMGSAHGVPVRGAAPAGDWTQTRPRGRAVGLAV